MQNQTSKPEPSTLEQELVELLRSAAMYNDKGWIWRNDPDAKQEEIRSELQESLNRLVTRIGLSNLPPELVSAIQSGAAVRDSSGKYREFALEVFADQGKH